MIPNPLFSLVYLPLPSPPKGNTAGSEERGQRGTGALSTSGSGHRVAVTREKENDTEAAARADGVCYAE